MTLAGSKMLREPVARVRSGDGERCGWGSELLVPISENANRLTGSSSAPADCVATDRSHAMAKVATHLAILQGMSKKAGTRYRPRLNILGSFALLHAVRSGMSLKPASPIRRG